MKWNRGLILILIVITACTPMERYNPEPIIREAALKVYNLPVGAKPTGGSEQIKKELELFGTFKIGSPGCVSITSHYFLNGQKQKQFDFLLFDITQEVSVEEVKQAKLVENRIDLGNKGNILVVNRCN